ncbi:transcription initiation factor TFIID subunit 12 [Phtheirospermum japonicum]|uniref:Transcription initiation factor TFIID subunit 12 n=1 Tax=Phtheirospermum japonicum TaxID=374723 RepID=A0A830CDA2_9LAMI|nr:transcription initiation factor TFIID subunit 12 [Phtheirospermum japonicum]
MAAATLFSLHSPIATPSAAVPTASSSLPPPTTTITTTSFPNPNPTPTPKPPTATPQPQQSTTTTPQTRPPFNTRPWQQQPYSHFTLPSPPLPTSSDSTLSSVSAPPPPRGGMAIGVPAQIPSTPPPPPFSSLTPPTYSQQSQIRPPMQGIGMTGPLGSTASMRPSHQLRPPQSSLRPPQASSISPSPSAQSFQGHGILRVSSLGPPGSSSSPSSSQSQPQTQPWLSSGTQGKPPLPTPSPRPQTITQSFQQRSHITPPHQHNMPTTSQQQQPIGSSQQQSPQPSASGQQPQDHFSPPFTGSRNQQSISHQQQIARGPGLGSQRPTLGMTQSVGPSKTASADTDESSNRIVSKRSIQELVNQIDPSEKLDPEVEDILVDIAEDFVESVMESLNFQLYPLESERNWNMTLPGFGGDEIKTYKKPTVSEVHRERLAAVKKSILVNDMMSKNSAGPSGGNNAKSHLAKGPAGNIGAS